MTNPTPDRNETIIRSVLFIAVVLLAVGIIVYLKRSTDVPLTPEGMAARDSVQRMASPDTTTAPAENAPTLDTTTEQSTDTVSVDQRLPSDAGYEDGYFAGLQDGLDDMERAETNMAQSDDVNTLREGLSLIFQKLHRTLEQQGLKKMDTNNAAFDTDYHEAVALFPTDEAEKKNHVIDCVQTGYLLNDKVLRHAKVVVGQ